MQNDMICRLDFEKEIVQAIKKDGFLYGKVAAALDRTPGSLRKILAENDQKLTQVAVPRILRKYLGVTQDSEQLTEMQEALKITT
jgi:hypothetical protein